MSGKGIVRRMDELGRIVIPKELRRSMRLEEGDEMEIFSEGEGLVVRKHSRFTAFLRAADRAVSLASSATGCEVFLASADCVLCAGGARFKELVSRPLSEGFASIARGRRTQILHSEDGFSPADGVRLPAGTLVAVPVLSGGDVTGCLFAACVNAEEKLPFFEFAAGVTGAVCEN